MKLHKNLSIGAGLAGIAMMFAGATQAATISVACDSVGNGAQICKDGAEAWAKKTGNSIKLISVPNSGSERLALYQQLLAANSTAVDVFMIDVVWPGILSNYFVDLSKPAAATIGEHFPAIVKNNTVNGHLIAVPWFIDAGLLYYRKDLLQKYGEKVPETWEDLTATAKKIQDGERKASGNEKMWGYVWQGKSYEGLTCNAIEWVSSYNGGTIVDAAGKVTVNNPGAVKALQTAKGWVGTISPKGVLSYGEEEARGVFQSGNAVFMRNWPYAWAAANSADSVIKDKVGIVALPKGGKDGHGAAALGGQQLAVSKFSKNTDAAIDLVMYLTGKEEQKRRAITGSYNPTIDSLYKDKDLLAANPFQGSLHDTFVNATARPSTATGGKYNLVSSEFWTATYSVLSENKDPADAMKNLEAKLNHMHSGGKW
jgi:trehalose/maltose transport system substrate-binding protein